MSYIRRNIDWSDPEARREYHRNWIKTNLGQEYQKRRIEKKRKLEASTKAAREAMKSHARVAAVKSYLRYDPKINWCYSRGIHRTAGSSFMANHQ